MGTASGEYNPKGGFKLLKGSYIAKVDYPSQTRYSTYRDNSEYINNRFKVLQDIYFESPDDAITFVRGRHCDGYETWRVATGVTLKKHLEEICIKKPLVQYIDAMNNAIRNSIPQTQEVIQPKTPPAKEEVITRSSVSGKVHFRILSQVFRVDSYLDMYYRILETLMLRYPYNVAVLGNRLSLNVEGVSLFSYNEHDERFKNISEKRKLSNNLWVGIVDDKDTILSNIGKILEACNCKEDDFKIL